LRRMRSSDDAVRILKASSQPDVRPVQKITTRLSPKNPVLVREILASVQKIVTTEKKPAKRRWSGR
jgi:hypothetical protein